MRTSLLHVRHSLQVNLPRGGKLQFHKSCTSQDARLTIRTHESVVPSRRCYPRRHSLKNHNAINASIITSHHQRHRQTKTWSLFGPTFANAVTPCDLQGMTGALDPTGAICGSYDEGVGTRICVDPWILQPGEERKLSRMKLRGFGAAGCLA